MDVSKIGFAVTQSDNGDPHVRMVPEEREHDTDTLDCWCNPVISTLCTECEASSEGCWACDGGVKTITREEARFETGPFIVVHSP